MTEFWDRLRRALQTRAHYYQLTFRAPAAHHVLKDLARFCRANESTVHADPRAQSMLEGRRQVWLRIQHHLKLSPDELWQLYSGRPASPAGEE